MEELAVVGGNGAVWILTPETGAASRMGVTVALPRGGTGPVTIAASASNRDLGARVARPGQPVFFGTRNKGLLKLAWTTAAGVARMRSHVALAPARVELPASP